MITVDKDTLDELSRTNKKVFVVFYSEWDGMSKMMFPDLKKLENEIDTPITICNIDYNYDLGSLHHVRGLPTFSLIVDGEIVKRDSSVHGIDFIRDFIEN